MGPPGSAAAGGAGGGFRRLGRAGIGRGSPAHHAIQCRLTRELLVGGHPGDEGGLSFIEAWRGGGEAEDGGAAGGDFPVILPGPSDCNGIVILPMWTHFSNAMENLHCTSIVRVLYCYCQKVRLATLLGGGSLTRPQPWTFVLSEYLDLAFVLRRMGELVVNARSATEALHCLNHYQPVKVIVDRNCHGAAHVIAYVQERHPNTRIEVHEQVIDRILAAG